MKVILCIGYHDTGSGAVDDFLREFDSIAHSSYGVECRFLQDPGGVSDLEFNIIENPHRLNTGYALKQYQKYVDMNQHTYRLIFGKAWKSESRRYISNLISFQYKGYWSGDMMLMGGWKRFLYYLRRSINKFLPKSLKKPSTWNYFPKEETLFCSLSEEDFLTITHNYVTALLNSMNSEGKEYVVLDQAASAMNINRYLKYFQEEVKAIVVDRDPRDVFIEETLLKGRVLPKEADKFCAVYKNSRRKIDKEKHVESVLSIRFEDMIYDYENTVNQICHFIGLDMKEQNIDKRKFFPEISKSNTRLWERHPEFAEDVKVIENLLPEFLYEF